MDNPTRIGIGATALATLAGIGAPLFGWWISGPIVVASAAVALWGFWPLFGKVSVGQWRLPLCRAARTAFEAAENAGLDGLAYGADRSPAEKLVHFMTWIVADERVRLHGRRPSSSVVRPILPAERPNLMPNAGGDLTDDFGAVVYVDVTVNRLDFMRFLRGLRTAAPS